MHRSAKRAAGAAITAVLVSLAASQAAAAADGWHPASPAVAGELIVQFERGVKASERRDLRETVDADFERKLLLPSTQVVEVDGSVNAAVRSLEAQDGVVYAEPNYVYTQAATPPNDARFGDLWGLRNTGQTVNGAKGVAGIDVNALSAWDTTRGAGQLIAIVDGGVALGHPDIAPNLWSNPGEIPGNGVDDDANGFKDDVHGWDFVSGDSVPEDHSTSHGTHVAGTAAGVAGNGVGVAGVAPDAQIMAIAGTGADGSGTNAALANGIAYAAREGATVINGSFGGPSFSTTMSNAIDEARTLGAVVVVSAGNDGVNLGLAGNNAYPCEYEQPNLVCVAALDSNGARASYSNWGATSVDVGAPGTSVLSAVLKFDNLFSDDFSTALAGRWTSAGTNNTWGLSTTTFDSPPSSLTDSPGAGVDYKPNTSASVTTTTPVSFAATNGGCRVAYRQRRDLEASLDRLFLGVVNGSNVETSLGFYSGANGGFLNVDLPLEDFDASTSVRFRFTLTSNGTNEFDGVHIDDFALRCRAAGYDAGSYGFNNGTSMASPHVAGAAALLRAAMPSLSADAVAARIRATTVPTPSLTGLTTTGGRVDAAAAIGSASPPTEPPVTPPSTPPATPTPPVSAPPLSTPTPLPPPKPCAGLSGKQLAECTLTREVVAKCTLLKGAKLATCEKKVRALAKCRALPAKGKRAKAKRAKCLTKAYKIGRKPKAKSKPKR